MKKLLFIVLAGVVFSGNAFAQKVTFSGDWLVTAAEKDGKRDDVNILLTFTSAGKIKINDSEIGTWSFEKNTVKVRSELFSQLSGDNQLVKFDTEEAVLNNIASQYTFFFTALNLKQIRKDNGQSGLEGSWQMKGLDEGLTGIMTFKLPDDVELLVKEPGVQTKTSGNWLLDKKNGILYLIGPLEYAAGKNKIIQMSAKELVLDNNGKKQVFVKMKDEKQAIRHLNFKDEDFYTDDGDFKYNDDDKKLPGDWLDPNVLFEYLSGIHQLKYKFSTLNEGTDVFTSQILTAQVSHDDKNRSVGIDYIFNGYDRAVATDDVEVNPNIMHPGNNYNPLWPEKDMPFRVSGTETVTVPAGTFECTVIDIYDDMSGNKKLWMINEKPGVYAKIIDERQGDFGYYQMYELQEIK